MRARILTFLVALLALTLIPQSAFAAPKKVSFRFSTTAYSVVEGNTTATITIQRTGNRTPAASVDFATTTTGQSNPATPGSDYTAVPTTTVNFGANEVTKTVQVTILDDTLVDPNETIGLKLSNPTPSGATIKTATATLTIIDNDGPGTIDFSSATYSVIESAGVATITVKRNSATNISESVQYTTTALAPGTGNATAGTDYMTTSGTLTFATGEMSKTFQVPIIDDSLFEGNEVLDLTLSNPQNLTTPAQPPALGPNNAAPTVLTIVDDDVPTFAFSSSTYSVMENAGSFDVTVTRGGATNVAASVDYADAGGGTAATPGDYTLTPGTLNFAAGETSKTFPLTIVNNAVGPEPNKTVNLALTQGATQVAAATLSISDDDSPTPSVQFSDVAYSAGESDSSVTVTVTLSKRYDGDVTVDYATQDGTATAGAPMVNPDGTADYQATSGTLTFNGNVTNGGPGTGDLTKTFQVPINPDTVVEGDETFNVVLSGNSVNSILGAPSTSTVTIVDDDQSGSLEFTSLRYDGSETGGQAVIAVRRVGGSGGAVSVDYATSDGTAQSPADYTTTTGTLNFADGELQKTFVVPIAWDGLAEGDQTVNLALSNPGGGADIGGNQAAALHIADDGASGPVQFDASTYAVSEAGGTATVTVVRSGGSLGGPVTVDFTTVDGTALAGSDYTATNGTLTFGPGETSKSFQVPITDDSIHEDAESFAVALSNPGGGTSLGNAATAAVSIADDDATPAANPGGSTGGSTPRGTQSSPGSPNPQGSQTADKVPPKLTLTAKTLQKALKAKVLVITVRSSKTARLVVSAKVFKGRKGSAIGTAKATATAGKALVVKVKLSKKALALIRKALLKGEAKVTLTVKATDAGGNTASAARKIKVQ